MNIFYLDVDPRIAASFLVDKHVVKMIQESMQMLSSAHRFLDGTQTSVIIDGKKKTRWVLNDSREDMLHQAAFIHHPCTKWARTSIENYNWLVEHLEGIISEYTFRYEKPYKTITNEILYCLRTPPLNIKEYSFTKPALAMPEEYKTDDVVKSYRNYYNNTKQHLFKWKKRDIPFWIEISNQ